MILVNGLSIDYFENKFNSDLEEGFTMPISNDFKVKIKSISMELAKDFKEEIIDFYFINGGVEITDENYDVLLNNFQKFNDKLLINLDKLSHSKIEYLTLSLMWTGIYTSLERDSKILNNTDMLLCVQGVEMILIKAQNDYLKTIKK